MILSKYFSGMNFPVEYVTDKNVRLKLTSRCQWSCHFCHMEGLAGSPALNWSEDAGRQILKFMDEMGRTKVHLTGGEPTIYPEVAKVVSFFHASGKSVAITTNGQFSDVLREQLIESGCSSFSFSLPTLSSEDFIKFHKKTFTKHMAKTHIEKSMRNILAVAKSGLKTDLNLVFSDRLSESSAILDFAFDNRINVSLLGVIGELDGSEQRIKSLIAKYNLLPLEYKHYRGTSRARYVYLNPASGVKVSMKILEPVYLESMCTACPLRGSCEEKFYGIRLEQCGDGLKVRTCVHKNVLSPLENFASSEMGKEILVVCK